MGLEEEELTDLELKVSKEVVELQGFEKRYRSSASAFVEQNFAEGVEEVYDEVPDKAQVLPRYLNPPVVEEDFIESLSDQAAYLMNFADIRAENIGFVIDELEGNNGVVLRTGSGYKTADSLEEVFRSYQGKFEEIGDDLKGVAMFIDESEELPGSPFNEYKELYHVSGNGRERAKSADPSDFGFPREHYWPFKVSSDVSTGI